MCLGDYKPPLLSLHLSNNSPLKVMSNIAVPNSSMSAGSESSKNLAHSKRGKNATSLSKHRFSHSVALAAFQRPLLFVYVMLPGQTDQRCCSAENTGERLTATSQVRRILSDWIQRYHRSCE